MRFAGLDEDQTDVLRKHRQSHRPCRSRTGALRDLFQRLQTFPDAARHFTSDRQIERLHDLQSSHWSVLTDARFDSLYAERVKVLSDTESKIGLDPRWQIAGHAVVLERLICSMIEQFCPKSDAVAWQGEQEVNCWPISSLLWSAPFSSIPKFPFPCASTSSATAHQRQLDRAAQGR